MLIMLEQIYELEIIQSLLNGIKQLTIKDMVK